MRDGLSLLDQAIAHGGRKVAAAAVAQMLGAIDQGYLLELMEAVAGGDGASAIGIAEDMQARSLSFDAALADSWCESWPVTGRTCSRPSGPNSAITRR